MTTKNTKLEDFIISYDDVIAPDVCQSLIDRFEAYDNICESGITVGGEYQSSDNVRKGHEINISSEPPWADVDDLIFNLVSKYWIKYLDEPVFKGVYSEVNSYSDGGYKFQRTVTGDYYHWHNDNAHGLFGNIFKARYYTFILYLNGGFEGGRTQMFPENIMSIDPKAGKMLWFPANEWYTHRCELVKKGKKYIITGWMYGDLINTNYQA